MKPGKINVVLPTLLLSIMGLLGMEDQPEHTLLQPHKFYQNDFGFLGVSYSASLDFTAVTPDYNFYPDEVEDTPEQDQLNALYGPLVKACYCAPVYIRYIDGIVNYGVFADCDLEPGQMLAEYAGKVVKYKHLLPGPGKDYAWNYVDKRFVIDGYQAGNFMRFVNHSYRPNLKWEFVWVDGYWHLVYIVDKPIKKDEQLFIDYGSRYWRARDIDPVELNTQN